jgi:hypothetical protein
MSRSNAALFACLCVCVVYVCEREWVLWVFESEVCVRVRKRVRERESLCVCVCERGIEENLSNDNLVSWAVFFVSTDYQITLPCELALCELDMKLSLKLWAHPFVCFLPCRNILFSQHYVVFQCCLREWNINNFYFWTERKYDNCQISNTQNKITNHKTSHLFVCFDEPTFNFIS